MMAQNIKQGQPPQLLRIPPPMPLIQAKPMVPPMPLIQAKPMVGQGIPIEHQQCLQQNPYIQGPYYFGGQPPPVMRIVFNPMAWYHHQDQLRQQFNLPNQYGIWYGMPYLNGPQVFRPKPPSYNQHPNGPQRQTGHSSCPLRPSSKTRSRAILRNHLHSPSTHGRTLAGGRSLYSQKSSADCCLNRIRSISSIQRNKGRQIQDIEQCTDNNQLKEVVSKESVKPKEEIIQQKNEEEPVKEVVKEEIHMEKVEEPSLDNESSGLFRRLARFMRFRSGGKSKNRKK